MHDAEDESVISPTHISCQKSIEMLAVNIEAYTGIEELHLQ